jgi:preprotein translocase subunit SecB
MEKKIEDNSKYQIIANYIKDLSFEIPSIESFLDAAQNLGKYETKIDISNKPLKNGILELNFKIFFEAPKDIKNKIHAEGCLTIIFKITDTKLKEEEVKRIILAEIPSLYGNKLSNLMADLFQKSGFKEFRFKEEINFEKLYLEQTNINLTQKH